MDALDFLAQACDQSAAGDVIDARAHATHPDWRHADALAVRMGLEPVPHEAGLYLNRREARAWTTRPNIPR